VTGRSAGTSTGAPKFVMVGIEKPEGGVRLYASRDIPLDQLTFALASDRWGTATGWHLDTEMRQVLIHDDVTWGRAFGRIFEIWENHDRNNAIEAETKARQLAAFHYTEGGARHHGTEAECPDCRPVKFKILDGIRIEPVEPGPQIRKSLEYIHETYGKDTEDDGG
jgi:hypothetical protein